MLWEECCLALSCSCPLQSSNRIFTWWQHSWVQQPSRRLPGPRALFIQLLQWFLQHPWSPVPLPLLKGVAWLEVLTGAVVSSCQVMSSLSICILVSPTTPELQAGSCLPQILHAQNIFSVNDLCAFHWLRNVLIFMLIHFPILSSSRAGPHCPTPPDLSLLSFHPCRPPT